MVPGDIYLAHFPYGGLPGRKLRPVLALTPAVGPVPEILVAYISSVVPPLLLPSDLLIDPSQSEYLGTNLKTTSVLCLHKLATIHQTSVVRYLGKLSPVGLGEVQNRLRSLMNL